MPRRRSRFWMFFQKIDLNTAECKLCGKHLRTCGNTTNLGKHIRRHPNYRELANQSGDSDDEKKPLNIKFEKFWGANSTTAGDAAAADEIGGFTEIEYGEKRTEEVFIAQDPLLEEENGTGFDLKPNLRELKRAVVKSTNSLKDENKLTSPVSPPKRIKLLSGPTTSGELLQPFSMESAHLAFAEFFFACNIPFNILNSIHVKRFLSKLNRHYRPPSLRELTTTYLDRAYDKYKIPMPLEEQEAVLMLSGWKDFSDSAKCIVACLYIRGETDSRVYLNTWDLNIDIFGTDENVRKILLEESIALAKEHYNVQIYAAVTDNLELNIGPSGISMWHSMCQSYLAGCLALDIVQQHDSRLVKQILKDFQREDFEAIIIEHGGARVILPWENRWCTFRDSFQCYIKNNAIIRDLLSEQKMVVNENIHKLIFDDDLVKKIESYVQVLDPLCKLIYLSQKKKITLADVAEEWLQLVFPPEFEEPLQHRRNIALTPVALTANFMHPMYRGRRLSEEQMESVEFFFLENLNSKGLDDTFLFKKNEGIFQILAEKEVSTGSTYWSMASRKHPELSSLARKLLAIPASVSYIDKIFTTWSTTHLAARNLLGMEVYRKITKTHFALNLAESS